MRPRRFKYPKPVIGLVGGVGAGKSVVAAQLASLGCGVIDSDRIARDVLNDPDVLQTLVGWWGKGIVTSDGRADRAAIGRIVFDKPAELARLEHVVHPIVHAERRRLRGQYFADPAVVAVVEDTPLLMEKGLDAECDVIIFIKALREQRESRVAASRGWDAHELSRREKNQIALDIKAQRADYSLDNDAGEEDSFAQVRRILSQIIHESTGGQAQPQQV